MKNKRLQRVLHRAEIVCAALIALTMLIFLFSSRGGHFSELTLQNGELDAREADFSSSVYEIEGDWTFYANVLDDGSGLSGRMPGAHDESIPYGTYRIVLHAQPEQYLMIGGYSLDYSTRVFVNGRAQLEIGRVGERAEDSEPRIDYMLIPVYTGADGTVELVLQYANFVHREGGGQTALYLSTAENIDRMRRSQDLYSLVLGGALCLFAVYFLLFAAIQNERKYFCLAAICLLLGLRDQNFYVLHLLPSNYNWAIAYRFLVLMISLQVCVLLLLLASLYEKLTRPWVMRYYIVLYAGLAAAHFLLPTQEVASLSMVGYHISAPFLLYILFCLVRRLWQVRRMRGDDVLILLGYLLLFWSNAYEAVFGRIVTSVTRHGVAPPYMLVFVLLIACAISIQVNRREQELSESRRQREVLEQLNRLKSEFLHQMAHELKTPLTVMSGYAQLTDWQLDTQTAVPQAHEHLQTISSEAQRLSALVTRLIDLANGASPDIKMEALSAGHILSAAADVCRPMLAKRGNRLEIFCERELTLWGSEEALMQVLINLTVNAGRHTEDGTVTYRAETDPHDAHFACIRVTDTGSGVAPETLEHIFEKGYSGDGGSGLGLYICRDIAQTHGGSLEVEHTGADGTTFLLRLPKKPPQGAK